MKAEERRDKKNQNNTLKVRPLISVVVQVEFFACVSSKCTANFYAIELKQLSLLRRCYTGVFAATCNSTMTKALHNKLQNASYTLRQITWKDKAYKVQYRLDYFLTTPNLTKLTRNCDIIHAPGSDHCAVKLFIQSEALNKKPGPGFWKFNCSLLENEAYINELKENIKAYRKKYDYLEDKGLKWDLLKMEMWSFTITYTKKTARERKDRKNATRTIK